MGIAQMVERLMMLAGAELAQQSYEIMQRKIHRLQQMRRNYGTEKVKEIEEDLSESIERLHSIKHVLEIHGVKV